MPEIIQSKEGFATVQYQLVVGKNQTLQFSKEAILFEEADLRDSVYNPSLGIHTFRTSDPSFLDKIRQVMSGGTPIMEFRLGFGTPQNTYWLPWQRHIIVKYFAKFEGLAKAAGHLLVFITGDSLVQMERSNKVEARKGTVSSIVTAIADENKLKSVVEPTDGEFLLYQSFQDDTHFIQERLVPRAITKEGKAGFYLYIKDNVLHFHTPDYQSSVRQMNYYDVFSTELTLNDISQDPKLWDGGIAGIKIIQQDPYSGDSVEVSSKPDKALRLSDSIYQYGTVKNGSWNMFYHLSHNPEVEVLALAQNRYQSARQQTFQCSVTVDKTIVIRHGDLLNLIVTQETDKASSHSGYYFVAQTFHVIRRQAIHSTYSLERGETRGQDPSLSAQNAEKQLIPTTKAPGHYPDILALQSSEATKGAGKSSSAKTYSIVADASTGKPLL